MNKNITIPFALFSQMMNFFDALDISDCPSYLRLDCADIRFALTKKQQSIELRDAYSKIINSDSDEDRHEARMQYLLHKREKYEPF